MSRFDVQSGPATPVHTPTEGGRSPSYHTDRSTSQSDFLVQSPTIALPKGGGAIKGIGEKFAANPVTGTGSMSVPIAISPSRAGFGPKLALTYDSGAGNGPFGLGWSLNIPAITRKTDKGLPRYFDHEQSDVFILAGAEDLVPVLDGRSKQTIAAFGRNYQVDCYRPRVEGLFALIERWSDLQTPAEVFWRTISRDNITTWFGRDGNSRIADPDDPRRIYQWLICQTHDDKGNVSVYRYVQDSGLGVDTSTVWEANRREEARGTNRYLKRILYGNVSPCLPKLAPDKEDPLPTDWMFELVFDFDDHSDKYPSPTPDRTTTVNPWPARSDAFSTLRAGFEVRNYRLCRRVLMFHHFKELGRPDYLVRSTEFAYSEPSSPQDPGTPGYTVLASVSHWAHQWDKDSAQYQSRRLPPVDFTYSQPVVDPTIRTIDPDQLENLPVGTQGPGYRWIDLDSEGLSGVLAENLGGWYYKPNLGDGRFGPMRQVAPQPALALAAGSRHQFMDLAGDGEIDVVDFGGPAPGFYERNRDEGWKRHVPFASLPNIDWQDPNLRFLDLTGDGHADALITEAEVFTWYPSLDERGFAASKRTRKPLNEDDGPRLVFADATQTIFLADMCGDGLTDLVRIRYGEICYWPNQGYGRFGRKVTLGNSPCFDTPDLFDPQRIRLADIDGSGPVDLIYLGRDGARLYFNRSGNSLSDGRTVDLPLATENLAAVQAADLLGNGTACLVWNSHLPADGDRPVRYIDLMGGAAEPAELHRKHEKPHLLIKVDNNLGATTKIEYTPSTRFYLDDLAAGMPWVTRLPFPVHCVSKVTVSDQWRGTAFSSTYSYHHGYFDGIEREFCGFGRVEQVDVEDYGTFSDANTASPWITDDHTLYQPPVKSITWYHTGAAFERQRIISQFKEEYFSRRFADRLTDPTVDSAAFFEKPLPEPEMPANLDADEWREALRACKGMVLRQEVYELDVDALSAMPTRQVPVRLFSAAFHNCNIQCIQPRGGNRHASFLVTESEALTYHYELDLRGTALLKPDPRIAHTFNLRHDKYGNAQQSITVGYPRWQPAALNGLPSPDLIHAVQAEEHIAYAETRHTVDCLLRANQVNLTDLADPGTPVQYHRLRLPCEVRTYELQGIAKPGPRYYALDDFRLYDFSDHYGHETGVTPPPHAVQLKEYHEYADGSVAQKRIVEHARTLYWDDTRDDAPPSNALFFGSLGPRGLKYEDYKLALTDELLEAVLPGKLDLQINGDSARILLNNPAASGYAKGTDIDPTLSGQYWMRSGIAGFAPNAHEFFFLPNRYTDPFGKQTNLTYYAPYYLFIRKSNDAKGNEVAIADDAAGNPRFDYRVLAPVEMVDANGNHSEAVFDIRGLVVVAATKGKQLGAGWQADNLDGFGFALANPSSTEVVAFCTAAQCDRGKAATWLGNASSRFVYHFGEMLDTGGNLQWSQQMPGACGIVRERHASQVAADAMHINPLQIALECSDGSGTVLMKKAQAEPDPDTGSTRWIVNGLTVLNNKGKPVRQYEPAFSPDFGCEWPKANGISTTTYYDAPGRPIRVDMPDGTFSRVEFSPWFSAGFDANDTVLESNWYQQLGRNHLAPGAPLPLPIPGIVNPPTADERAGWLAAQHADTPAETHFDSLGREVIAIAHNRTPDHNGIWQDEYYLTFTKLDAEGKPLWICDARGNLVMQYISPPGANHSALYDSPSGWHSAYDRLANTAPCYDIAGNLLFQHSMDAGDSWMISDSAGKPMLAWDANDKGLETPVQDRLFRTEYDALHRPTKQWLKLDDTAAALIESFDYCDTASPNGATDLADAQTRNLIGQAVVHRGPSGKAKVERVDLCSKSAHVKRTLIKPDGADANGVVDWNGADPLDGETFHQITEYDALGRMTRLYNWHRDLTFDVANVPTATPGATNRIAIYEPGYNERGALKSEGIYVRAGKTTDASDKVTPDKANAKSQQAIQTITYNAKGQKLSLSLGNGTNGTTTRYTYDDRTFRLINLYTRRGSGYPNDCTGNPDAIRPARPCGVQNLHYIYDPVGNITHIQDDAQQTIYFKNTAVEPSSDYAYDALYRLIQATGRENAAALSPPNPDEGPWSSSTFPSPNGGRNYAQSYVYDAVGNFIQMRHLPSSGTGWTRRYTTLPDSNRLYRTWYGDPDWNGSSAKNKTEYRHDIHGNMLNLNRTPEDWGLDLQWDWRDMIRGFDCIGGGIATYHYGIDKQRTRKRIVRNGGAVENRIYLGGYELYRRSNAIGDVVEEIETNHLFEGEQRVLMVDDVFTSKDYPKSDFNGLVVKQQTLWRYQYGNHLGSVGLELDDNAQIISYEEFHPYGTSAYRLMSSAVEAPAKRYRYTGMERDEESALNCHVARYYACWLGRWISCDPEPANPTMYSYTHQPLTKHDLDGRAPKDGYPISEPVPWGLPADVTIALAKKRTAEIKLDAAIRKSDAEAKRQALAEAHRADLQIQGAEEFHDFHSNVGLPFVLSVGSTVIAAPAGAALAGTRVGAALAYYGIARGTFGVGETIAGKTVSLSPFKPSEFRQVHDLKGIDRYAYGFQSGAEIFLGGVGVYQNRAVALDRRVFSGTGAAGRGEPQVPAFRTVEEAQSYARALGSANKRLKPHVAGVAVIRGGKTVFEYYEVSEGLGGGLSFKAQAGGHTEPKALLWHGAAKSGDTVLVQSLGTYGVNNAVPALQPCAQCNATMMSVARDQNINILYDFSTRTQAYPGAVLYSPALSDPVRMNFRVDQ